MGLGDVRHARVHVLVVLVMHVQVLVLQQLVKWAALRAAPSRRRAYMSRTMLDQHRSESWVAPLLLTVVAGQGLMGAS